jgi:diguanylate cyclase (GGDEF)-like protein
MERAQSLAENGESVRDADGNLRRNLEAVSTDDLNAEYQRLAELNGNEESAYRAVQEAGYRADYEALPSMEKTGRSRRNFDEFGNKIKRQAEDLPDAGGAVDPEQLLADNKTVADYHRNATVRAARAKAMERIQRELDARGGETSFDFGANASEGGGTGSRQTMLERSIIRAKSTLTQVEREFALRGVTGDKLARLMAREEPTTTAKGRSALESTRQTQDLVDQLRAEGERRSLERAAKTDELTGLGNQRAFHDALPDAETDPGTSVIRFDANGFKAINDALGHQQGDQVLARIGEVIRGEAEGLPVFRVGGDEFAVFAPKDEAPAVRDAIEQAVGVQDIEGENGKTARFSISGGVGDTSAEADAAAIARKAEHKAEQGIGGRGEPPAPSRGLSEVEGTGATRTRGLASGVERKALVNHLELTVGDLPEYRTISMAQQATRASELLAQDPELARRVATGEALAPRGLLPESVFVAVEQRAIEQGDVNTLRELATGRLTSEATTMGQRIRALGERDPDSPVSAMQEIVNTRTGGAKNAEKVLRATDDEVEAMTKHLDAAKIDGDAWAKFIESIKC